MKKTFVLSHPKITLPRLVDAIKHEVNRDLKRQRNKKLPDRADFWDFDCRFGADKDNAEVIHLGNVKQHIDEAVKNELPSFYLEVLAKPSFKNQDD
jgi:hypothetical protein